MGALLVGALVLAALLAYQAFDAGRSHAVAVHKTLGEQAQFAAWEYANNARSFLDSKLLYPGLDVAAASGGKTLGAELAMENVQAVAEDKEWDLADIPTAFFRLELATGQVAVAGDADGDAAAWVARELRRHFDEGTHQGWEPVMVADPSGQGIFVFRFYPEDRREAEVVYGFRLPADGLRLPLSLAFAGSPLLPEGLTGGRANDQVFAVRVRDGHGHAMWNSDVEYVSDFAATDTLGGRYAGLAATVVVNPVVAPSLVIGGLPRSRLPLILTLLALTAGLVGIAFRQLRRETELARLRADFVSGVSHELRTPLAQIRMFSETLLLGRVRNEEERRRSLEIIANESRRLTHQVDNVLLYSRTERQGIRVDREPTRLDVLARDVAEAFRPLAEAADCRLSLEAPGPVEALVDPSLVRQALLNLLDNALKYGPPGQAVRMGLSGNGQAARLWVQDQGPGVPPADQEHIWRPYFRSARHRESAVAGSGIGLSVVREVALAHGGSARVEAGRGGGARFVLTFPATPAPEAS